MTDAASETTPITVAVRASRESGCGFTSSDDDGSVEEETTTSVCPPLLHVTSPLRAVISSVAPGRTSQRSGVLVDASRLAAAAAAIVTAL